jgi:hypothetical protein
MVKTILEVTGLFLTFIACIAWATQGQPLSEAPHHDEY